MVEPLEYEPVLEDVPLCPDAIKVMEDPSLHPIAKAIYREEIVDEKEITSLEKAGKGGQGDVYNIDKKFCAKFSPEYNEGDKNPELPLPVTISRDTVAQGVNRRFLRAAVREIRRMKLC